MIAIAAVFALTSCEDFLDTENREGLNNGNFPSTVDDLNKEISALYGVMNQISTNPLTNPYFYNVILGDEINGAGGDGDTECHAIGHLQATTTDYFADTWKCIYVGIARAAAVISTPESILANIEKGPADQLVGEAYFMRGLFYLWGVQTWGDIPAYWGNKAPDPCPQVSAEDEIMPHIIQDFYTAYKLMDYNMTKPGDGHASKAAAAGFLARAYMFYQGFYKGVKDVSVDIPDMELPDGGTLSKKDVYDALANVWNSGKYSLVKDYRLLWQYTNQYTAPDYEFVKDLADAGQFWAGNGNSEEIFQIQYGNMASWNGTIGMGFTNQIELYCGLRCDDAADGSGVNGNGKTFPYAQGWGQGTVNANAYEEWPDTDPRKKASVIDAQNELEHFVFTTSCTEDAGLYNKKLIGVTTKATADNDMTAGPYTWWGIPREEAGATNNNGNCMQGDHFSDVVLMRLSDILLMHSELTNGAKLYSEFSGLNIVQDRAGVAKTSYTLARLQDERRWEFFGEGLRFNDLRRWSGKNGGAGCMAAKALEKQNGSKVNYKGRWTTMKHGSSSWAQRYAETDGFMPKPSSQIDIVGEDVLQQNEGWTGAANWSMTSAPAY